MVVDTKAGYSPEGSCSTVPETTKMPINSSSRQAIGEIAAKHLQGIASQSNLVRRDSQIEEVTWGDMKIEATIGVGGYSRVYRALSIVPDLGFETYALKCLNKGTMEDDKIFETGAIDLTTEGELLSRLLHENVIQLHGHSAGGPANAFCDSEKGYFLILDLLETTLKRKLDDFRRKAKKMRIKSLSANSRVGDRVRTIALGVAKGLQYLHTQNVVWRDLKPDNIGFDASGTPKLFDLGFAREVHALKDMECAGSLRYMAPEVSLGKETTLKSDVYSFGVLLWELCTLEKPFQQFSSRTEFKENVTVGGYRPSLNSIRSASLRRLIASCWDHNPNNRPTMESVIEALREEIADSETRKASNAIGRGLERVNSLTLKPAVKGVKRANSWTVKRLSSLPSFSNSSMSGSGSESTDDEVAEASNIAAHKNEAFSQEQLDDLITPRKPNIFLDCDPSLFQGSGLLVEPSSTSSAPLNQRRSTTPDVDEFPEEFAHIYEDLEYELDLGPLSPVPKDKEKTKMKKKEKRYKRQCMSMLDFSLGMVDYQDGGGEEGEGISNLNLTGHNSMPDMSLIDFDT